MRTRCSINRPFVILTVIAIIIILLTSCNKPGKNANSIDKQGIDIDQEFFESIKGDYYVKWNDEIEEQFGKGYEGYWNLYIIEGTFVDYLGLSGKEPDKKPYFACIDGEAGNPGFEGEIIKLKDNSITIKLDMDYFEDMPFDWEPVDKNYVILEIKKIDDNLELSSKGKTLVFERRYHEESTPKKEELKYKKFTCFDLSFELPEKTLETDVDTNVLEYRYDSCVFRITAEEKETLNKTVIENWTKNVEEEGGRVGEITELNLDGVVGYEFNLFDEEEICYTYICLETPENLVIGVMTSFDFVMSDYIPLHDHFIESIKIDADTEKSNKE